MIKKVYEFLIWNNCGNACSFCHQRLFANKNSSKILNPEEQIRSLSLCEEFLDTKFENGNHILLVGGELFDIVNENVKEQFKRLLTKVISKMLSNEIDLLYLNTNLLFVDVSLLYWFLDKIDQNDLFNRLKFTTSYDIVGRFLNKEKELLFYKNLKSIKDNYPNINIVVNTVLTNETCRRIQNDIFGADFLLEYLNKQEKEHFTIKDWIDYFKVDINTIPYIRLNSDAAPEMPTRAVIFDTLLHINKIIPNYLEWYANNIGLKQEKLLFEYNKINDDYVYCSSEYDSCGHSENFKMCFKDSDKCFPCEIKKLSDLIKNS